MKETFKHPVVWGTAIGLLALFFFIILPISAEGYGHAGYNSYDRRPSMGFFVPVHYYGGVKRRSIREGSTTGPSGVGGGFSGGK